MARANVRTERLTDLLTGQVGQGIKQFGGASGLSYLIRNVQAGVQASIKAGTVPLIGEAAAPYLAFLAIPSLTLVDYIIERRHEHGLYRDLLSTYGEELSALSGIALPELTVEKTKEMIRAHHDDPRFAIFREATDLYANNRKTKMLLSFVGAALTAVGIFVGAAIGAAPLATTFFIGTGSTLLVGVLHTVFSLKAQETDGLSVNKPMNDLVAQSHMQQLEPARVMQVYAQAQPTIQRQIIQQFGKPYVDMTLGEKKQVVAMFDALLHLTEITQKINNGTMRPTELAWIVYGQHSGVAEKMVKQSTPPNAENQNLTPSNFVARLENERSSEKTTSPTLH